jgi:hypothetical protein
MQDPTPDKLVEELRTGDIEVREAAGARLLKLGKAAVPALEKAAKDVDPELSLAARRLLEKIADALGEEAA